MSVLGTKRDRDKERKWETGAAKRKVERVVSDQTESGSTESNESVPSTSQQHLSESPLNLEVTTDAVIIATERRKSEIEIGSKACQS
ncbi:UNVERIFIED_CONTAM: hypothetical protein NCL1_45259 [Trichonephila clavipes]